jgi:hypothetical protein
MVVQDADNKVFDRWIKDLPDLDAEEFQASRADIDTSAVFGVTEEERKANYWQTLKITYTLTTICILSSFLVLIWGHEFRFLNTVNLALPLIVFAVVAASKGRIRLYANQNDQHPDVGYALLLSVGGLAIGAWPLMPLAWYEPLYFSILSAFGILFALPLTFTISKLDIHVAKIKNLLVGYFILMFIYGFSAAVYINTLADIEPVGAGKISAGVATPLCANLHKGIFGLK